MYRKEVNDKSPLRILEQSIHGGLGPGNLGVVIARAGIGKTAFLIQVALDDLLRDRDVLHIAVGQSLEHIHAWYEALFDDLARATALDDRDSVRAGIGRHSVIHALSDSKLDPERLEKVVNLYRQHLGLSPTALLIDGHTWEGPVAVRAAEIGAYKALARRLGAELWMTAPTHRERTPDHPTRVPPPVEPYEAIIDVAVFLEPEGNHLSVRLLKDHEDATPPKTHLVLDCETLRLATEGEERQSLKLPAHAYTLLSGGAEGAEEAFGSCAERFGLLEINFSFAGRRTVRSRGLIELKDAELRQGAVSHAYLASQLHRRFPDTPGFRKMLQTIWHQVVTAGEIFAVGTIQADQTVKGGTGWAAELGRHFKKPVHVFDQEKSKWFRWQDSVWAEEHGPKITHTRFAGTGTRHLLPSGRAAIAELFETSFGTPR